jgi:hypothetical protein
VLWRKRLLRPLFILAKKECDFDRK